MSVFTVVRTGVEKPSDESTLEKIRGFLFGCIEGARTDDRKAWRKFWKRVMSMEPGEMIRVEMAFPRNPKFHRKFFALLNLGFDAWEPDRVRKSYRGMPVEKNFEQFREDITILAGFYEQTFDLRGRMKLKAKSISFASMDDMEFEKVYSAVADVLLQRVLHNYSGRAELDEVVERVMGFM